MTQTWTFYSIKRKKKESLLSRPVQRRQTIRILRVCGKRQFAALKGKKGHGSRKIKVMFHAVPPGRRYADAAGLEICASEPKEFLGCLCRCGGKWLKWLSHLRVIQRRKKWVIGRGHPSASASSFLDDFLPLYSTRLASSPHFFLFPHFSFAPSDVIAFFFFWI